MGVLGWTILIIILLRMLHNAKKSAQEEQRRKDTPCRFVDGFSEDEFSLIVEKVGHQIKRISNLETDGPLVYGTVQSQSGISEWNFKIDFNDYGHITNRYWIKSDNSDSNIPKSVAEKILYEISVIHTDLSDVEEQEDSSINDDFHKFCTACGKENKFENAKFCAYCGSKLY